MKKTSLMLAISALLYGTSTAYVFADDCPLHEDMTLQDVQDYLDSLPPTPDDLADVQDPTNLMTEGGDEDIASTASFEPFYELPDNVHVSNEGAIEKPRMCNPSYQVDGGSMAEFPVTVSTNWDSNGTYWHQLNIDTGFASGKGWLLVQSGDTWDLKNPWRLYTCSDTTVSQIVLEPIIDSDGDKKKYAFDIGGLTKPNDYEHTAGSARGRPIKMKVPPRVDFEATYSRPVYITNPDHAGGVGVGEDSTNIHDDGDTPTHDLYGKLTIDFSTSVSSAELEAAFRFVADTDCVLPVTGGSVDSDSMGNLNLTLFGEGLVYVKETDADGNYSLVLPPFEVTTEGVNTFDIGYLRAELQAGNCYSLVNEDALDSNISLEVNGEDLLDDQYCP
jgi:hypothetical protein